MGDDTGSSDDGFTRGLDKLAAERRPKREPPQLAPKRKLPAERFSFLLAPFTLELPSFAHALAKHKQDDITNDPAHTYKANYREEIWKWAIDMEAAAMEPFKKLNIHLEPSTRRQRCTQIMGEYELGIQGFGLDGEPLPKKKCGPFGHLDSDELRDLEKEAGFKLLTFPEQIDSQLYAAARALLRVWSFKAKYEYQSEINLRAIDTTAFVYDALVLMERFMEFRAHAEHHKMSGTAHAREVRRDKKAGERSARREQIRTALADAKFKSQAALAKYIGIHPKKLSRDIERDPELRELAKTHGLID